MSALAIGWGLFLAWVGLFALWVWFHERRRQ